jgi:hypothetical protein
LSVCMYVCGREKIECDIKRLRNVQSPATKFVRIANTPASQIPIVLLPHTRHPKPFSQPCHTFFSSTTPNIPQRALPLLNISNLIPSKGIITRIFISSDGQVVMNGEFLFEISLTFIYLEIVTLSLEMIETSYINYYHYRITFRL